MTEPCPKETKLYGVERDISDVKRDLAALELAVNKIREDVNAILNEAGSFKVVLRTLQVIGAAALAMLYDYIKKRLGW